MNDLLRIRTAFDLLTIIVRDRPPALPRLKDRRTHDPNNKGDHQGRPEENQSTSINPGLPGTAPGLEQ
ncbi:MAG: hypothetical protein WKH97_18035 [Casimicrobiaceae bacterium]